MKRYYYLSTLLLLLLPAISYSGALEKYATPQSQQSQQAPALIMKQESSKQVISNALRRRILQAQQTIKQLPPDEQRAYIEALRNKMAEAYQQGNDKAADYYKRVLAIWE